MPNEIKATFTLKEGSVRQTNYLQKEKLIAVSTDDPPISLMDEENNEIYEGLSSHDIMIDLNDMARKRGFAGVDPDCIPKITRNKNKIKISFLATDEVYVNVIA